MEGRAELRIYIIMIQAKRGGIVLSLCLVHSQLL